MTRSLRLGLAALSVTHLAFAANVRTDRPRIFLGDGNGPGVTPQTFKNRCLSAAPYARCKAALSAGGGSYPAINDAAGYVVNGDAARCTAAMSTVMTLASDTPGMPDAHSFISNNGRTMANLAVVRDWCDPVLSGADKSWLEAKITAYADWYSGGMGGYAPDVYHDDMNNVWNAVALAGLALAGTAQDAKAQTYLSKADVQWKNVIFPALAFEGDFWHEGFVYVQPAVGSAVVYATAWSIATSEDVYAWAKANAKDLFEGYLAFHLHSMRPNHTYAYFGDTTDNKQSVELFSRQLVDMMTLGTGSPLGQRMSLEIQAGSRPGYDYSGADGYWMALLYDVAKDAQATPLASVPTARWMSRGAADVVAMRSGWTPNDTYVWLSCGDYFGAHQHIEAGAFQIFKGAPLTGSTGYYDAFESDHFDAYYSQHSVHANTLAVYQPGEFFPTLHSIGNASQNVDDGGQRPLRRNKAGTGFPNPDLAAYMTHRTSEPWVDTADIEVFEQTKCHVYAACDMTAAYSSPGHVANGNTAKVKEVTRQLVYLPPDLVVVFDRVESTDPSYDKRFLLQTPASPQVTGGDYVLSNGAAKLFAKTLLPDQADVTTLTGFMVDGKAHPPTVTGTESFGTRLEISPKQESARDYFLHVLSTAGQAPTATMTQDATGASMTVQSAQGKYDLRFLKTGAMAGHIVARDANGDVLCDEDLGAMGQTPDGGVPPNPQDDAGIGDKPPDPRSGGGCGCSTAGDRGVVPFAVALALAMLRRRRARARS